jgi:FkbM family methyltransferase
MLSRHSRHRLVRKMLWNPLGARLIRSLVGLERRFDQVVRGFSLESETNGERWLAALLPASPTVVDVGFHRGDTTRMVLNVRPAACVHAFDPAKFGADCYRRDFASDSRVVFNQVALAESPGKASFHDYGSASNSLSPRLDDPALTAAVYEVGVSTLDEYVRARGLEHVDLLKVDAEGHDLNVLEGARSLLAREGVSIVVFEFASGWAANKRYLWEAVELFKPLSYKLFRLNDGFLSPLRYDVRIDSCTTLQAMYVAIAWTRLSRGDIEVRDYGL